MKMNYIKKNIFILNEKIFRNTSITVSQISKMKVRSNNQISIFVKNSH